MTWSVTQGSAIFREWIIQVLKVSGTTYTGLDSDAIKAALFATAVTPDKDAVVASTGYNTGTWTTGNEKTGASQWVAGGIALTTKNVTSGSSGVVIFSADNIPGSATVTMSGVEGCLVYDDTLTAGTVADQGVCFNWFGGTQSVTAGTFSVNWNANGIFRITV